MKNIVAMIGIIILLAVVGVNTRISAENKSTITDAIDGFRLLDSISLIIQKYGPPDSRKKSEFCVVEEDSKTESGTFDYKQKGITFEVCEGEIRYIDVHGKSTAKTSKGIGIGSTRVQVIKSYGKPNDSNARYIVYAQGEVVVDPCLTFFLRNGKVSGITLSSDMAGCESQ